MEFSKINIDDLKKNLIKEGSKASNQFNEWHDVFEILSYCKKCGLSETETHSVLSNRFELIKIKI